MFLRSIPCLVGCAVSLLAANSLAAAVIPPSTNPAGDDNDSLSLVPRSLPVPPELLLGSQIPRSDSDEGKFLEGAMKVDTMAPLLDLTKAIGQVLDVSDVDWPIGTVTTGHFQWMQGDGQRQWVPFFSVLQEVDEIDAHVRNGVGLGVTYRFDANARIDLEGQFIQRSGNPNPVLSSEERVSLIFSFTY